MRPLPFPTKPALILSFDFDGTLHHSGGTPPVPVEFFEVIQKLREEKDAVWGINTGRSMPLLEEGFLESHFPFLPDWCVAREREIYFPKANTGWQPSLEWNAHCQNTITALFDHASALLRQIRKFVEEHTGAHWQEMDGEPAGFITQNEEEMEWLLRKIEPMCTHEPDLSWQRNSIWLRFGHRNFQKGTSLAQIAKHYELTAAECFAIGDGHNDLEMLDPIFAKMNACPANSVNDIKEKIVATGGYIAKAKYGNGSIEALKHYFRSV